MALALTGARLGQRADERREQSARDDLLAALSVEQQVLRELIETQTTAMTLRTRRRWPFGWH